MSLMTELKTQGSDQVRASPGFSGILEMSNFVPNVTFEEVCDLRIASFEDSLHHSHSYLCKV